MVYKNPPQKQEDLRQSFESKKSLEGIDIFSSQTTFYKSIQFGKFGANPNNYSKAKQDIMAVSRELMDRIEKEEKDVQ